MSDDAWGDLFAEAANVGSSSAQQAPSISSSLGGGDGSPEKCSHDESESRTQNKKRKRKRNQKTSSGGESSSSSSSWRTVVFEGMLQNRIHPTNKSSEWPRWLKLAAPILQIKDSACAHWIPVNDSSASSTEAYRRCANCGTSALNHRVEVNGEAMSWPFLAFGELRNLRCAASIMARKHQSEGVSWSSPYIQCSLHGSNTLVSTNSITQSVLTGSNELSSMKPLVWRELPQEEARILESKLNDVIRFSTVLANSLPQTKKRKKKRDQIEVFHCDFWESAVRLIIACDALYFRIYYLQLVQLLPTSQTKGETCFIPHPSNYFGLACLTLDVEVPTTGKHSVPTMENKWLNAFEDLYGKTKSHEEEHPLVAIHRLRQIETMAVFQESGWMASPQTEKLILKSLEKFADKDSMHETPAPDVLMQWRDGCRDLLCNLYAYATLSSKVIHHVSAFLVHGGLGVVEIGAGTGYIAKLLNDRGVHVDAWDVHPTSHDSESPSCAMNEYHGNTPSFLTVKKCSKLPDVDCEAKALLLCYPPPGSVMAHDTLQMYLRNGGNYLVHIGEFKGLTGESRFESLLVREMTCHSRRPCLSWGTDASHVTIWAKNGNNLPSIPSASSKLLLPCSYCGCQEGIKRCRLLRSLVYCSKKCFEDDDSVRTKKLHMQSIHLKRDALAFTNPRHFITLQLSN